MGADKSTVDHRTIPVIPAHGSKGQAIWEGRRGKRERAYQHVGSSIRKEVRGKNGAGEVYGGEIASVDDVLDEMGDGRWEMRV